MEQLLDTLAQVTAGERIALVLLSAMALIAMNEDDDGPLALDQLDRARPLQRRAWRLIAWAAIAFSPFHAAVLVDRATSPLAVRFGDVAASGFACAALICVLASLAIERGVTPARIRRGTSFNIALVLCLVLVACLTH